MEPLVYAESAEVVIKYKDGSEAKVNLTFHDPGGKVAASTISDPLPIEILLDLTDGPVSSISAGSKTFRLDFKAEGVMTVEINQ